MIKASAPDFGSMSIDELWQLHEELSRVLSARLTDEKRQLEKKLAQLRRDSHAARADVRERGASERRKYPQVLPKYRNPNQPSETWSGRGKQPKWLVAALETGHKIEEFAITPSKPTRERRE